MEHMDVVVEYWWMSSVEIYFHATRQDADDMDTAYIIDALKYCQ